MAVIYRPCYSTREEVKRALDVKGTARNNQQIDRQLLAAADSVEQLCKRLFYTTIATKLFDWPNFQYTYPWKLYFHDYVNADLAGQPTLVQTGTNLLQPVTISLANCIFQPVNIGPPFTRMELRRDTSAAFGSNTTPQNDISITGPWGYWQQTSPAGSLAAAVLVGDQTVQLNAGSGVFVGPGDVIIIDSENMIVTDANFISTGIAPTSGGTSSPPSAADNSFVVPNGTAFSPNEIIMQDSEAMLIQFILGNTLVVKRAFDGTVLATHSLGTFLSQRQFSVIRGALGTTAAAHNNSAPVSISQIPGLVKELSIAESVVSLTQEPNAYAFDLETRSRMEQDVYGGTGHAQQREPAVGIGMTDLRDRCYTAYGYKGRSRVV